MPVTAFAHFRDDLGRARSIRAHAVTVPTPDQSAELLRDDLLRSAWMMAVGALDAYFCDAYSDLVAATVICKSNHPLMALPAFVDDIRFPLRAVLQQYPSRQNMRWRMAARRLMDREDMLDLEDVRKRFNPFFRPRQGVKLFAEVVSGWVDHPDARWRMFGIRGAKFRSLTGKDRADATDTAHAVFRDRFRQIIQRRHDCIHNCDRPRTRPQPITAQEVGEVLDDVEFLVERCDRHIASEFWHFLTTTCGCPAADAAKVGYPKPAAEPTLP